MFIQQIELFCNYGAVIVVVLGIILLAYWLVHCVR